MENICKCNNCEWEGSEEELSLVEFDMDDDKENPTATECKNGNVVRIKEEPIERDFLKGCPNCLTDAYLCDLNKVK